MSHFYGTVDGKSKTMATRTGSKNSGITTHAASWEGAVRVDLDHYEDEDRATVVLDRWHGGGQFYPLYLGPVDGPRTAEDMKNHVRFTIEQALRRGAFPIDLERAMTEAIAEITKG